MTNTPDLFVKPCTYSTSPCEDMRRGQRWRSAKRHEIAPTKGMSMIRFSGLVAAMVLAHGVAIAQDGTYRDADNIDQAAGMMHFTLKMVETMSSECKRRFPGTATSIDAARDQWRHQDAREIEVAERRFSDKAKLDPSGAAKFESAITSDFNEHVLPWLRSLPETSMSQACSKYFEELTSGVSRQRTPNEYKFLAEHN